jgi:excisionase family DNA binding protein
MPTPLMTVRDVAEYLGVSEPVVRHILRTRQLGGLKVSGAWRITHSALQEYVLTQLTAPRRRSS